MFDALTAPLLAPFRRLLPRGTRLDFSPLIVLLLIQVALIVVNRLAFQVIGAA